jgi:hypothetical protein
MSVIDTLMWSFLQNYHLDKANACIHCAPVRFSPITFRLYQALEGLIPTDVEETPEMAEVRLHLGAYKEDKGR